jgi:hypothetical protein
MTLLFPITRVVSYHPTTGKLIIDMKDNVNLFLKLRALQDILIKYVEQNQGTLFRGSMKFSAEQIESQFQKLVNQNVIILYCPSSETGSTTSKPIIPVYKDGWNRTLLSTDIVNNADVRIIIKIVGLSFQMDSEKIWTGKFRLQHKIVAVFIT